MKVVSLVSLKGGAGRTTLAWNLALEARRRGMRSLVLHAGYEDGAWVLDQHRIENNHDSLVGAIDIDSAEDTNALLLSLSVARASGIEIVFIDSPSHNIKVARAVVHTDISDLILVPTQPHMIDLIALAKTKEVVSKSCAYIVFNQMPETQRHKDQVAFVPAIYGFQRYPGFLHQDDDYLCMDEGLGVVETHPSGRSAFEISDLFSWCLAQLELPGRGERLSEPKAEIKKISDRRNTKLIERFGGVAEINRVLGSIGGTPLVIAS